MFSVFVFVVTVVHARGVNACVSGRHSNLLVWVGVGVGDVLWCVCVRLCLCW